MTICRTLATYKGRPLLNAPRSDPYGRDSRIGLPPRVFDAEAVGRPRMEGLGRRQPFTRETFDPFPCRDVLLASRRSERRQRSTTLKRNALSTRMLVGAAW